MQLVSPQASVASTSQKFLDPTFYTETKWLAVEQKLIFGANWIYAGSTQRLPETGSTIAIDVAGANIIITRNAAGELKAFHNVCAHRAAPLRSQAKGDRSCLVCPYHGWVYNLDGELTGLPGKKYFPGAGERMEFTHLRLSE
jgi:choline monooxygenase